MTLKNTNTKYQVLEMIATDDINSTRFKVLGIMTKKNADKEFGDYEVLSVRDFKDTCTTSVIIKDNKDLNGYIIKGEKIYAK